MSVEVNMKGVLELDKEALISGDNYDMRRALQKLTERCNEFGQAVAKTDEEQVVLSFNVYGAVPTQVYNEIRDALYVLSENYSGPNGGWVAGVVNGERFHDHLGSAEQRWTNYLTQIIDNVTDAIVQLGQSGFTQTEIQKMFDRKLEELLSKRKFDSSDPARIALRVAIKLNELVVQHLHELKKRRASGQNAPSRS